MPKIVRILAVTIFIVLILAVVPWITDYAETGHWPEQPIEFFNEITASCITLLLGALVIYLIYEHQKNVEGLLITDPLTQAYNMRFFSDKIHWVFMASKRTKMKSTLLFMDLDGFKKYNDTYGHLEGNKILQLMGEILLRTTRRFVDWPFRIGGDEFAVLMEFSDKKSAEALGRRLKDSFDKETHGKVTLTVGISEIDDSMNNEKDWIKKADAEMYRVKKMGSTSRIDSLISKLPK